MESLVGTESLAGLTLAGSETAGGRYLAALATRRLARGGRRGHRRLGGRRRGGGCQRGALARHMGREGE